MTNKIDYSLASSEQIVADIGRRLAQLRLASNVTQAEVAARAGLGARTIARLESGEGGTLDSLVRIMQALGLQPHLEAMLPDPEIRPIERIRGKGRERQRARAPQVPPAAPFKWGER